MRRQNSYRVINEDIAALRNIAWAMMVRTAGGYQYKAAFRVYTIMELLLDQGTSTVDFIKDALESS